jgi:Response regulator containing CheY-like receiver, AAA-type ATPase, and DNA-binding domains
LRRILVAEDEANMRWVLERALTKAGYEVEMA